MKGKSWFFIIGLVAALCVTVPAAHAAWVDITPEVGITTEGPVNNLGVSTVRVTVKNMHETFIEGAFRLLVTPAEGTGDLLNFDGIKGEDGQTPTPYFDLLTADEDLWDQAEEVVVEVQFAYDGSDPAYALAVAVNDESVIGSIFRKKISKNWDIRL